MALKHIEKMDTGTTRLITVSTPAFIDNTYGTPLTVPATETNYTMAINNTVFGVLDISNFGTSTVQQSSYVAVYGTNLVATASVLNYRVLKNGSQLFTGSLEVRASGVFSLLFDSDFSDLAGNSMQINFWSTGSFEVTRYSIRNAVKEIRTGLEPYYKAFTNIALTGYEHVVSSTTRLTTDNNFYMKGFEQTRGTDGNLLHQEAHSTGLTVTMPSTETTIVFERNTGYFHVNINAYFIQQWWFNDLYESSATYYSYPLIILSVISMDRE